MLSRFEVRLVVNEEEGVYSGAPTSTTTPPAVDKFIRSVIGYSPQEQMLVLYLDMKNRVIGHSVIFTGTMNRAAVEPRPILAMALLCNAAGFIVAHNHPSGLVDPSVEDMGFANRMDEAARLMGMEMVDFLICGPADGEVWSRRQWMAR